MMVIWSSNKRYSLTYTLCSSRKIWFFVFTVLFAFKHFAYGMQTSAKHKSRYILGQQIWNGKDCSIAWIWSFTNIALCLFLANWWQSLSHYIWSRRKSIDKHGRKSITRIQDGAAYFRECSFVCECYVACKRMK